MILLVGSLRTFVFSFFFPSLVFFSLTFTDTFFTLDVYLGHGDAVRVVDPELGKLERENLGDELPPHGISLNTPILGTTSTSTRRHTRREFNPGMMMMTFFSRDFQYRFQFQVYIDSLFPGNRETFRISCVFDMFINDVSSSLFLSLFVRPLQMLKKMIL